MYIKLIFVKINVLLNWFIHYCVFILSYTIMKRKLKVMVNNSATSINKQNNHLLPQITKHRIDHTIRLEINIVASDRQG